MLDRLVNAVTDLPVIVQGALGSALFALVLFVGQRVLAIAIARLAHSSKKRRKQALVDELAILNAASAKDVASETYYGVVVLYRTGRHLVRGLLWLTLGLVFGSTISVFGLIGYIGCLYYLFQALRLVEGGDADNAEARLKEINTELNALAQSSPQRGET